MVAKHKNFLKKNWKGVYNILFLVYIITIALLITYLIFYDLHNYGFRRKFYFFYFGIFKI